MKIEQVWVCCVAVALVATVSSACNDVRYNDDGACNGSDAPECINPEPDSQPEMPDPNPDVVIEPNPSSYRFVIIEDFTPNVGGDIPGADIDAVGLIKPDGREIFLTTIEASTDIDCTDNLACDPAAALGPPDAIDTETGTCFGGGGFQEELFVALNRGFLVGSFGGDANGPVTINNGDAIHVYEIGATECGRFDDDPYEVSLAVSDDLSGDIVVLGSSDALIISVSGLD